MSLEGVCFYFFVHVMVKLGGRVGCDVDCCYTKSELYNSQLNELV